MKKVGLILKKSGKSRVLRRPTFGFLMLGQVMRLQQIQTKLS